MSLITPNYHQPAKSLFPFTERMGIVHTVHGIGIVTDASDPDTLSVSWGEEEGRIVPAEEARPQKVRRDADVRPITQQEATIAQALYRAGERELAWAWLKEGKPHPLSPKEKALQERAVPILDRSLAAGIEPTDEEAALLAAITAEAEALPEADISTHSRVSRLLHRLADEARTKQVEKPRPLEGKIIPLPTGN